MSWEAARFLLELAALSGAFVAWFYAWQAARAKASHAEVEKLRDDHGSRLTAHGERLTRLESGVDAVPKRNDIEKLHARITELMKTSGEIGSDVASVAARIDGVEKLVDRLEKVTGRLEQYLLERG